jgi:MoaA/NifB/PqqE/SkfB family radical SAM enzyme
MNKDSEKMENNNYINLMNASLQQLFITAFRITLRNPRLAWNMYKVIRSQNRGAKLRARNEKEGVHVPPFMIASVTKRCNLKCKGCYAQTHSVDFTDEMSPELLTHILSEAQTLGISICLLAGGEPLARKDLLNVTRKITKILFPLFTNGMLMDDAVVEEIKKQKQIIPVISVEGFEKETDERRGSGVYEQLESVFARLNKTSVFWGVSITVTSENIEIVTGKEFIENLINTRCRLFFYVEYIPVEEGSDALILNENHRKVLMNKMEEARKQYPAVFIAFPGDEEDLGGCLAAGRGFIHISSDGKLEPCPFAPYSDSSLKDMSLKEALKSEFLRKIRDNHSELNESVGGCALFHKKDWMKSLLQE